MVVDPLEKGDSAFRYSGAVARRGVSGRNPTLSSSAVGCLFGVFMASRVCGTGVTGGSDRRGTILRVGDDDVNKNP